jgi:hypothetical protein
MPTASPSAPTSKRMLWASYVISAIPVLLMLTSAIAKFVKPASVVQGFTQQFGFQESYITPIGILELTCLVLYLIPRTSVLGAILLTGYLGGATVTHLRVGDPAFVGAVIVGIFVWGGLFFREPRLRALIPFRSSNVD